MLVGEKEKGKGKEKKKRKKSQLMVHVVFPVGLCHTSTIRYSSTSHTLSCTVNNPTNQRNSTSARNPFDSNHSSPPFPPPPILVLKFWHVACLWFVCCVCPIFGNRFDWFFVWFPFTPLGKRRRRKEKEKEQ